MMSEEQAFLKHIKESMMLKEMTYLADWDSQTGMPEKSADFRAELMGYLNELIFEKDNGVEMQQFIEKFEAHPELLSDYGQQIYKKVKKDYDLNHNIPSEQWADYSKTVAKGHGVWAEAREKNDFSVLEPLLTEMVNKLKALIPLWQTDEQKTPYDVLLDQYEPGMTTEILDDVFAKVRDGIMDIRRTLEAKGTTPKHDFLKRHVPREQQEKFVRQVVTELGFDFSKGRLDDTIHPFMQQLNRNDVRITTRWNEDDAIFAIFGVMHEAGHGTYEQHIDSKWDYTPLTGGVSMGIHESQSLFNELIIGSSRAFWEKEYPFLQECMPAFKDISLDTFYKGVKYTQSSFIRIEADPLTYPLHIIIRYEIEKMLFNDNVEVKDLPQIWNDKYEEYLGIRPTNDLEGILQDVHWPSGLFGYFPSYALGFMYAAQLYVAMERDFNMDEAFKNGEMDKPSQWLKTHIHQYGSLKTPHELIEEATGESLNPMYLLNYLRQLYFNIYEVNA